MTTEVNCLEKIVDKIHNIDASIEQPASQSGTSDANPVKPSAANLNLSNVNVSADGGVAVVVGSHISPSKNAKRQRKFRHKRGKRLRFNRRPGNNEEDGEAKRVNWLNRRMQIYGKTVAPYNTTQFIMDDHNVREPNYEHINKLLRVNHTEHHHHVRSLDRNHCHRNHSVDQLMENVDPIDRIEMCTDNESTSDEFYSSPDDEQDFMQQQFCEAYKNSHAERLNSMSKIELIRECLTLDERIDDLEKKLKETNPGERNESECVEMTGLNDDNMKAFVAKAKSLELRIKKLNEENQRLRIENGKMQGLLREKHGGKVVDGENNEMENDIRASVD